MIRRPPRPTRTDTLFPDTPPFRAGPQRGADEPAILGRGPCRPEDEGRGAPPYRLGSGASGAGRPSGGDHRRKLRAGQSGLERRLRPLERKSVVSGNMVSLLVVHDGSRSHKKKTKITNLLRHLYLHSIFIL